MRMNLLREMALSTYYYGTLPVRTARQRRLEQRRQAPGCVLFYHRVADKHPNAWTISNDTFRRHMLWLLDRFEFVSLRELQDRMRLGGNARPTVSITFDDGYADNYDFAIPFLLERNIPFTYFVSLHFVLTGSPFPHDRARGIPLAPNTIPQLQAMALAGVEIGAHTRTHVDLGEVEDSETLFDEVVTARDELQRVLNQPVRYFAFPYGMPHNLNPLAIELAQQAGFAGVCSAYGAYNHPGDDPFHIKRIHGDPEFSRLRNWMTLDPRKLGR